MDQAFMMQRGRITDTGTPAELIEAYGRDKVWGRGFFSRGTQARSRTCSNET